MRKIANFIRAQKAGIAVGLVAGLIVIAIAWMSVSSTPKVLESQPTNTESPTLTTALESSDFNQLKQTIGEDVVLVEIERNVCCVIADGEALDTLIEFLQLSSNVKFTQANDTDAKEMLTGSDYDYTEFSYFSTNDGKSWIAIKLNDQNKVEVVIIRYPSNPPTEVIATPEEIPEEEEVEQGQQPQSEGPTSQPAPPAPFLEYWGLVFTSAEEGKKYTTTMTFVARNGAPLGSKCTLTLNSTLANGSKETASKELTLSSEFTSHTISVYPGVHDFVMNCMFNDNPYTKTGTITINQIPLTVCDTKQFELGDSVTTLEETQTKMVGKWRGCAHTPFGDGDFDYGVEVTFNADGTYSARNYDLEMNNGLLDPVRPLHPAFYYGTDDDLPNKRFEFDTFSQQNGAVGVITIAFNANNSIVDTLRNFKVSADGQRLSFGFIHNGRYGPIVYELEKVAE